MLNYWARQILRSTNITYLKRHECKCACICVHVLLHCTVEHSGLGMPGLNAYWAKWESWPSSWYVGILGSESLVWYGLANIAAHTRHELGHEALSNSVGVFCVCIHHGQTCASSYCWASWLRSHKYHMFMARYCCLLIILCMIPMYVLLSMCTGIGGCGFPFLARMRRMIISSWVLRKRAPSYVSVADVVASLRITHIIVMFPLSLVDWPSCGILLRKEYSPDQLRM